MPAIALSASAAMRSIIVQVGERNTSVSERIALHSRPAIWGGISNPFSR